MKVIFDIDGLWGKSLVYCNIEGMNYERRDYLLIELWWLVLVVLSLFFNLEKKFLKKKINLWEFLKII